MDGINWGHRLDSNKQLIWHLYEPGQADKRIEDSGRANASAKVLLEELPGNIKEGIMARIKERATRQLLQEAYAARFIISTPG